MRQKTIQCVEIECMYDRKDIMPNSPMGVKAIEVQAAADHDPVKELNIKYLAVGQKPGLYLKGESGSESYTRVENLVSINVKLRFKEIAY